MALSGHWPPWVREGIVKEICYNLDNVQMASTQIETVMMRGLFPMFIHFGPDKLAMDLILNVKCT